MHAASCLIFFFYWRNGHMIIGFLLHLCVLICLVSKLPTTNCRLFLSFFPFLSSTGSNCFGKKRKKRKIWTALKVRSGCMPYPPFHGHIVHVTSSSSPHMPIDISRSLCETAINGGKWSIQFLVRTKKNGQKSKPLFLFLLLQWRFFIYYLKILFFKK